MRKGSILSRRREGATKPYLTYPYFQEAVTAVAAGEVKASEEGKYPVKKEGGSYPTMRTRAKPTIPLAHPEVNTKPSQSPQNDYFDPLLIWIRTACNTNFFVGSVNFTFSWP